MRLRPLFLLLLALATMGPARAQLNNWDPAWYNTDSGLVFHDDLDYYLNAYSKAEIKAMRKQVNIWRMNWDKMMRRTIREIRAYSEGHGMVPRTHDFTLADVRTGTPYHLRGNNGRIRAFMLGSVTNPPARVQMERWSRLLKKYAGLEVDIFMVYGPELHPGDRKRFKAYPPPNTMEEKQAHARALAELGKLPVLVDGMDDAVFNAYGRAPNSAYVVDKEGHLIFRGTWADDRKVEHILDTLLQWYKAGQPRDFLP